jgi:hypothetical protein
VNKTATDRAIEIGQKPKKGEKKNAIFWFVSESD